MTLRTRLALGMLVIAVVLIAPLLISMQALRDQHHVMQRLRTQEFTASLAIGRMRAATEDLRNRETQLIIVPEDSAMALRMMAALGALDAMADSLRAYELEGAADTIRAAVGIVREHVPREIAAALEDRRRRTSEMADSISNEIVRPAIARIEGAVRLGEDQLRHRMASLVDETSNASDEARRATITALVGAAALATMIAIWLTGYVTRPVRDLERGMEAVAGGDFDFRLSVAPNRHDEFAQLATSYQSMASQLKQLDRLKAEFVSIASHELKTPINVLLGYLQLLQEDVYGPLEPKQREICGILTGQTQALARLVRQLLDISRFEAGREKLEVRPIRLAGFLGELESAFRVLALQRGVRFHVERLADIPETVVWDEDRMNEVLGNLLSNAFKFTERGGTVELSVSAEDHTVHMRVRDTGAGIPPEQVPHIFDKFYQANNQGSASAKGTGLGLAIAKGIVEAHGGQVSVESTVGVGTTFSIDLPIERTVRRTVIVSQPASEVIA